MALLVFLALSSFVPAAGGEPATNLVGAPGIVLASIAYGLFGASAFWLVAALGLASRVAFSGHRPFGRWEEGVGFLLAWIMLAVFLAAAFPLARFYGQPIGGWVGHAMAEASALLIGRVGTLLTAFGMLIVSWVFVSEETLVAVSTTLWRALRQGQARVAARSRNTGAQPAFASGPVHADADPAPDHGPLARPAPMARMATPAPMARRAAPAPPPETTTDGPPLDLSFDEGPVDGPGLGDDFSLDMEAGDDFETGDGLAPAAVRRRKGVGSLLRSLWIRTVAAVPVRRAPVDPDLDDLDAWSDRFDLESLHEDDPADPGDPPAGAGDPPPADDRWSSEWRIDAAPPAQAQPAAPRAKGAPVTPPPPADLDERVEPARPMSNTDPWSGAVTDAAAEEDMDRLETLLRLPVPRMQGLPDLDPDDAAPVHAPPRRGLPSAARPEASLLTRAPSAATPVPAPSASAPAGRSAEAPLPRTERVEVDPRHWTVDVRVDEIVDDAPAPGPLIVQNEVQRNRPRAADLDRVAAPRATEAGDWRFPPLSFLRFEESPEASQIDQARLHATAARLTEALESFKVTGQVTGICPGPVVTRFEFEPDSGIKVARIAGLTDDLAMALKAFKVRIIAPVPGRGCVGIEVPNEHRETVYLKELLADERFVEARSPLAVAVGKDIEGVPVVADFARFPHLLIAGTTGSGKSVAVNAMITSILYNASPDDVRMILIDPKQLEFAIYQHMPHLLLPVVTDPAKATTALQWAVTEMERRYGLMADLKVRNLDGYNKRLVDLEANMERWADDPDRRDPACELLEQMDDAGDRMHRRMFYILIVVDEFADLMMTASKDVETAVARLAQKARAAGIHLLLATQRPSVDVLTGVIKANFPTRMSCRLMSGTDSRTVLDSIGAENLLGQGDMLYRANGSQDLQRVHGAYIDEREIEKVVDYLKAQRQPEYDDKILRPPTSEEEGGEEDPPDELYDEGIQAVIEAGFASISMVQRKLRIGYNRAARMVERMERDGIVGPATGGSTRREVLMGQLFRN
jgi:S-DNA-T family DNA segregation ATPase FtsK/SpoIIIE